jgi:hypothetical protein
MRRGTRAAPGFEEVRDIMLEGVRTLKDLRVCEANRLIFDLSILALTHFGENENSVGSAGM